DGFVNRARGAARRSLDRRKKPPGPGDRGQLSWVETGTLRPAGRTQFFVAATSRGNLVGAGGFEPPNGRSKVSWLTTCRRPNASPRGVPSPDRTGDRRREPMPPKAPFRSGRAA